MVMTLEKLVDLASKEVVKAREYKDGVRAFYWGEFVDWLQEQLEETS